MTSAVCAAWEILPACHRPLPPAPSHLSEDEAGGGGAAVGTLQPAASGIRAPVHLETTKQALQIKRPRRLRGDVGGAFLSFPP